MEEPSGLDTMRGGCCAARYVNPPTNGYHDVLLCLILLSFDFYGSAPQRFRVSSLLCWEGFWWEVGSAVGRRGVSF